MASGFSSQAITSGAIQYGVPINVFLRPTVLSSCALTPKSTGVAKNKRFSLAQSKHGFDCTSYEKGNTLALLLHFKQDVVHHELFLERQKISFHIPFILKGLKSWRNMQMFTPLNAYNLGVWCLLGSCGPFARKVGLQLRYLEFSSCLCQWLELMGISLATL